MQRTSRVHALHTHMAGPRLGAKRQTKIKNLHIQVLWNRWICADKRDRKHDYQQSHKQYIHKVCIVS